MLPKKNRVDKKNIDLIFKKGKFIGSPSLTFKFFFHNSGRKVSFIVPKNVAKLAVQRNLLKRYGYSALKELINRFPVGVVGVFVFKKPEKNVLKIKNEIKNILNKIS